MSQASPQLEEFTIGWICALPIELSAATAVLDEEYDDITEAAQYVLGRMGVHKVVLACLPAGQYGTTSAAVTAAELRTKFSNVQYWLMVGIGGGVPHPDIDMRLGDVVVCQPQQQHGGVVQYDLGKTLPNGQYVRTGALNAPPAVLGTAASMMQSRVVLGRTRLSSHLAAFRAIRHFHRPSEEDLLFEASYAHVEGRSCDRCARSRSVDRSPRASQDVVVHFGLVASGNQVIRDGVIRDKLSQDLGGVMCFEMEAAGLVNSFPCLIIRGICDYADSHKSKTWQPFAAAAAAACAKELLSFVPSLGIVLVRRTRERSSHGFNDTAWESTPTLSPNLSSLTDSLVETSTSEAQKKRYFHSLRFSTINARHAAIRSAHLKTCQWILDKSQYQSWLDSQLQSLHHGFFWLKGNPGTGKSTLMKYLLANSIKTSQETTIVSFFFNARGEYLERSTMGMYRSVLFQLLEKLSDLQDVLALVPPKLDSTGNYEWNIENLKSAFKHAVLRLGQRPLTLFIDALDECAEAEVRDMVSYFEHIGEIATENGQQEFRTCFSSRHYPHIAVAHCVEVVLENEGDHDQDIEQYLATELRIGHNEFVNEVKAEILKRASGIFLWVILVVQILNTEFAHGNKHSMRRRLTEIPDGLDRLFEDILTRDDQNKEQLVHCLQWVLYTRRPLSAKELYYGILAGTESNALTAWNDEMMDLDDVWRFILHNSKGLVEETRTEPRRIQFIHESVRDFLRQYQGLNKLVREVCLNFEANSHDNLKVSCQSYLTSFYRNEIDAQGSLHLPQTLPDQAREVKGLKNLARERYPFLQYAAQFVLRHSEEAEKLKVPQDNFLQDWPLRAWIYTRNLIEHNAVPLIWSRSSLLYVLAELDLPYLIKCEFRRIKTITTRGGKYIYPLYTAAVHGNASAIKALLTCYYSPTSAVTDHEFEDAVRAVLRYATAGHTVYRKSSLLSWAVNIPQSIVWKLITPGGRVNVAFAESNREHLLYQAARNGHIELVEQLLELPIDWNGFPQYSESEAMSWTWNGPLGIRILTSLVQEYTELTFLTYRKWQPVQLALFESAANGHVQIVHLLLNTGKCKSLGQEICSKALMTACIHNKAEAAKLLLERIPNQKLRKIAIDTALKVAIAYGTLGTVTLLLTQEVPVASLDGEVRLRLLIDAVKRSESALIQLLLASSPPSSGLLDAETQLSFLSAAAREKDTLLGSQLLTFTIRNIDLIPQTYWNLLTLASQKGDVEVAALILQHADSFIENRDSQGRTGLEIALESGNLPIVQLLLNHGADPNLETSKRRTNLMDSAREGWLSVVEVLLAHHARPNWQDHRGRTALMDAVSSVNWKVVGLLLNWGADPNLQDRRGRTALMEASSFVQYENVRLLLDRGANPNLQDHKGRSALIEASSKDDVRIARLLLDHRAKPDLQDHRGRTALMNGSLSDRPIMVQLLLDYGADTNIQDSVGRTALMDTSYCAQANFVELLLEHGADRTIKDNGGKTALDWLFMRPDKSEHLDIQRLLINISIVGRRSDQRSNQEWMRE